MGDKLDAGSRDSSSVNSRSLRSVQLALRFTVTYHFIVVDVINLLLSCLILLFSHLKLGLLTQFLASNDEKYQ